MDKSVEKGASEARSDASWVLSAIRRCETAFVAAKTYADRLALLRSLARLLGGRLDLAPYSIVLSAVEQESLSRFGLAITNAGQSVRIVDEEDPSSLEGLSAALVLDSEPRQLFEGASPDAVLLRLTSHKEYRTVAQKSAVRALLTQPAGSGLMVSMPTGSGKSLLFQIAACFEREQQAGACSVVITPTIALALDHERTLSRMPGLENSRALTGDTPLAETEEIINGFRCGTVPVLLLSPEKALSTSLIEHLVEAARPTSVEYGLEARLTHLFVDEAHIVETWGRSFRPDFQRLPSLLEVLRNANPAIRAVLLSATLSETSRSILRASWQLTGDWLEVDARLPRYEHDVVVGRFAWESQRQTALDHVVDRAPRPLILYTTEVEAAVDLRRYLVGERGYGRVALFTGETSARERKQIVRAWADDEYDVVVATSAFGMGIDKPDVRSIVHACLPEGPARWYQEIGRASRDGGQGFAACLFVEGKKDNEVKQAYGLATSGWLTRELAEKRWDAMLKAATDRKYSGEHMQMTIDLDAIREGLRPRAGDWNRGWNMTLLTLLQRAGVLRVLSVPTDGDQPDFAWTIEVINHKALSGVDNLLWNAISEFRAKELAEVRADLDAFVSVMRMPEKSCVTRTVFELIEPRSFAPPCGRCPSCRKHGVAPPRHLPVAGLEIAWQTASPGRCPLPPGTYIVVPDDPHFEAGLGNLINSLVGIGVDQFVIPTGLAAIAAELMVDSPTRLGFVMSEMEWTGSNRLAALPSAFLLSEDPIVTEALFDRIAQFEHAAAVPTLVVARPERVVRGRRLDQIISRHAPYSVGSLNMVAASGMRTQ